MAKRTDEDFDAEWINPPIPSISRILYFDVIQGIPVLTSNRPVSSTVIMPKTYFGANPGVWTEILSLTAAPDIANESVELVPGDRFAAKVWLVSDMAQNGVLIRLQAYDTTDGVIIGSATATIDLTDDGVAPIPVPFDDVYGVLRELTHGDIRTSISIMPVTYGFQVGVISNPPNEVSYINTDSTSGGIASGNQEDTLFGLPTAMQRLAAVEAAIVDMEQRLSEADL